MWIIQSKYGSDDFYPNLEKELFALIDGEPNLVANLSNLSSWLFHAIPNLNWAGFYLWQEKDQELVLGPFQGMPACIRIKPDRGVCGKAYSTAATLKVDDVDAFPGHIACDSASQSELVIPLIKNDKVLGVLDLDSPEKARFSDRDAQALSDIFRKISPKIF
jgi:L-methionine (R)-S-oxide reductase